MRHTFVCHLHNNGMNVVFMNDTSQWQYMGVENGALWYTTGQWDH